MGGGLAPPSAPVRLSQILSMRFQRNDEFPSNSNCTETHLQIIPKVLSEHVEENQGGSA